MMRTIHPYIIMYAMLLMCSQIPVVMDENAKAKCVSSAWKVREAIPQYSVSSDLKLLGISSKEKDYLNSFKLCDSIHSHILLCTRSD